FPNIETRGSHGILSEAALCRVLAVSSMDLLIAKARAFALHEIGARVSTDPALAAAFWDEVDGSNPASNSELTVLYAFLRFQDSTFALLEFVSGQTLEQLCSEADPSVCDRVIPL